MALSVDLVAVAAGEEADAAGEVGAAVVADLVAGDDGVVVAGCSPAYGVPTRIAAAVGAAVAADHVVGDLQALRTLSCT